MYLERADSEVRLNITGYNAGGAVVSPGSFKQLGLLDIPAGTLFTTAGSCDKNTEAVMFISAGYRRGEKYYPMSWSVRNRRGLEPHITIPEGSGNMAVEICDIYGGCNLFEFDNSLANN